MAECQKIPFVEGCARISFVAEYSGRNKEAKEEEDEEEEKANEEAEW